MLKRLLLILFILSSITIAEDADVGELKFTAWGYYTFGRVMSAFSERVAGDPTSGTIYDIDVDGEFLSDFNAGIKICKSFDDYCKIRIHSAFSTIFIIPEEDKAVIEFRKRRWGAYLIDAAFEYNPPMDNDDKLKLEFGYLPAKYNPEAVNLGAYLFRSTAYPSVIESGFEMSGIAKQVGFHLAHTKMLGETSWWKSDFYMGTEMTYYPNFDFSPSLIFTGNFGNVLQLGVGGMYQNLISVDEEKTTPGHNKFRTGMYVEKYIYCDSATMRPMVIQSINEFTNQPQIDTVNVFDTTFYTFRGLKLMGRLTFDPKPLLGMDDEYSILSPADLKIFGEAAILGVKNYPGWYQDITDRIPIMFGINLPTFRLLDILCLQMQYFKNPYWNTVENVWRFESPVPYVGIREPIIYEDWLANDSLYPKVHDDDVKWSVYMSKSIFEKKLRFSLQFANDNYMKNKHMPGPPSQSKYTELTKRTAKDWYLMGRLTFYLY